MNRRSVLALVVVFALTACAGGSSGDDGTTTTGDQGAVTTTTAPESTTTSTQDDGDGSVSVGIEDLPQECIDAFVDFLQAIEPYVEDIDFENATFEDLATIGDDIDPVIEQYDTELAATDCDKYDVNVEADDDQTFDFLINLAQDEAPGTVPYFEWLRDLSAGFGDEASGDCDTDIASMEGIIAGGGTMQDLSMGEISYVGNLMTSISINCDSDTSAAFFSRSDVQAFIGSS